MTKKIETYSVQGTVYYDNGHIYTFTIQTLDEEGLNVQIAEAKEHWTDKHIDAIKFHNKSKTTVLISEAEDLTVFNSKSKNTYLIGIGNNNIV